MSHSHSHAPGESHSHSHGPPQPQPLPTADPALLAVIEADFRPISVIVAADNTTLLCEPHKQEKCSTCNLDYVHLNRLSKILAQNPNLKAPPPGNVISKNLSQAVNNTKEEGNAFYKMHKHKEALGRYTMAASIAVQRPPWESNQLMREELSTVLSNRSASYFESEDYISALADAETVIAIRRNWSKGHFRKARSLVGLGKLDEAVESLQVGLAFEPNNAELGAYLEDIQKMMKEGQQS
ncbi:hypothetical protein EV368DRAFT_84154 [Lentinula lateritia]|uniref:Uncharacterized protein n=1 Tax=Lentinula aff. lateritia TaxID=2804960 RepID=A0ACC1U937_9AGAR|nr:hypothetical protein F5876DRAFT_73861 [Lentinula aff. lateritia]KAJ3850820.1 hypothetical protein EV368DRAFT_84154 [Lentinula lateritia]